MDNQELIKISLIIAIVILLAIYLWFKNKSQKEILKALANLEKQDDFLLQIEILKEEINSEYQQEFEERVNELEEAYIEDAIYRSKSVSKGKIVEHFAPFLIGDWIKPSETIFGGSPIDLISFKNFNEEKSVSIEFIEIKTGKSSLSKKQRLIRDAIHMSRVFYKEVKLK